jgi:hypothetical protein
MTPVAIPAPVLDHDPAGPVAEYEQPVTVKLPAFVIPGGPLTQADVKQLGAFVYRRSGGSEDIWNETTQLWQAVPADLSALKPLPLQYKEGDPLPWQGMLIAAGQKDKNGAERFAKVTAGQPRYVLRASAELKRGIDEYSGLSAASEEITFVGAADNQRFGVELEPPKAREAVRARMQLRDASRTPVGWLEIRTQGGREVEIVKCDDGGNPLSSVLLADDGSIHLRPAAGREIVLEGDLRARRVRYEPYASGVLTEL